MNDFRFPNTAVPSNEGLDFLPTNPLVNQPASGPRHPRIFWKLYNAFHPTGNAEDGRSLGGSSDSAQLPGYSNRANQLLAGVRLWNPALRCVANPFGDASRGLFDPAVVKHLPIQRPQTMIRAAAGQANAFPPGGGSGSAENVRIPAASTLGAF